MWEKLREEIRSPLAFSGWVIGVIGFILSIYSWYDSSKITSLSYFLDQKKDYCSDRNFVKQNQYLKKYYQFPLYGEVRSEDRFKYGLTCIARLYIWNDGDHDIDREKIRKAISVNVPETYFIHKSMINVFKKFDNSNFQIEEKGGNFNLYWNHFYPRSGVYIEIFYSINRLIDGKYLPTYPLYFDEVKISGDIFGIDRISDTKEKFSFDKIREINRKDILLLQLCSFGITAFFCIVFYNMDIFKCTIFGLSRVVGIYILVSFLLFIWETYADKINQPPSDIFGGVEEKTN